MRHNSWALIRLYSLRSPSLNLRSVSALSGDDPGARKEGR